MVAVPVPGLPFDVSLRARSSDADVFRQVFEERQADVQVQGDPRFIIDAGANIGLASVIFAARFPRATVLALEIDAGNYAMLRRNTEPYGNVIALHKGFWHRRAKLRIANPDEREWAYRAEESSAHDADIEALGMDDILDLYQPETVDLLKIDIEGGELDVFSEDVTTWIPRVKTIAIEIHDRKRQGCSEAVRNALAPHGYIEDTLGEYLVFTRA